LSRQDYGMIAMISIFSLIATALQESGFRNALANLRQPPTHRDYNSVFWLNVIVGVSCYVVLFLAAPLIADFYHTPDLILLCRVAFLSIIFSCLGTAQSAYLFRNLKVKEQARCNMISTVVSNLVGLTMAFLKCGYWSLAVQTLVYIGMNTLLLWRASDWRPTFHLDFGPVRRMFRFSFKIMATTILERVNTNVMNVLLGKFFSKPEVGDYNQAYQWSSKVFYLMQGTLGQVAQPVFTNVADERERQLRVLRKLVRLMAFLSFPLLFGFGMTAREFIVLAIGMKWIHSAELLQLLCMSGAFIPVCSVLTNILISKGKSGIYFWCTFMQCLLLVCTMLVLHPYGIRTMVMAYAVIYILWTFVWHFFVSRLTGYTLLSFLKDILGFALTAFAVMAVTWLITCGIESLLLLLLSRVLLAVVLYFAAMRMFRVKMLDECMTFVTSKIKKE
jgi:O-antigen/teichoic acid export membrane protein